ncbi:MAG: AAA family ATPase [bacterium]|nr:AAA family ATPase [bacterium]
MTPDLQLDCLGALIASAEHGRRDDVARHGQTLATMWKHETAGELVGAIMDHARLGATGNGFAQALIGDISTNLPLARLLGDCLPRMGSPVFLAGYTRMAVDQWRESERARIDEGVRQRIADGFVPDYADVQRRVQELDQLGGADGDDNKAVLTASAMLALPDAGVQWTVDALIPKGELTIMSGIGASGKSFLSSWLCIALSRGLHFLGKRTEPGTTLYVDCENSPAHAAHRFRCLGLQASDRLHLLCTDAAGRIDVTDPVGFNRLRDAVTEAKADNVVIDTLRRVTSLDMNDSQQVDRTLSLLRAACGSATPVVLAHHRKSNSFDNSSGERLAGSVDLRNFCRSHLVLVTERVDDVTTSTLQVEKSNFAEGALPTIRYSWARDPEGWLRFIVADGDAPILSATERFILKHLDGDGMLRGDVIAACEAQGINERDAQRGLTRLAEQGMVAKSAEKVNGQRGMRYVAN